MKCVILQSNYLPWKGYFDLMAAADVFVFHDDLQYTKGDWRNRNRIKTPRGPQWLTVPVGTREDRLICETTWPDDRWKRKHLAAIEASYRACPHFDWCSPLLDFLYDNALNNLSDYNQRAIRHIAELLGIDVRFADSRALAPVGVKTQRVIDILQKIGATRYISGPAGAGYLDETAFDHAGIALEYFDYGPYPEYDQPFGAFEHRVSIVDTLMCTGPEAASFIRSVR